ncbi:MAG: hypothetical protein E5Y67_12460 [Mesorhizobium sp.]|uniref:hypothetical protein n=1 Tax=Mesorhizobium sp. TaxID=1871066 RepID=UPI0012189341|nr:hypothetical protein [Mesorhizobium sp.]TIM14484.1 MAG: hypothetical protein E5Y67_12460 [Mesorhizobium sp.]
MEWKSERNWRETEKPADAARRLTAIIDERNERRKALAGGKLGPAHIQESSEALEKRPEESKVWGARSSGLFTPPREEGSDHVAEGENGNGCFADGVGCAGPVEPDDVTMRPSATSADPNRYVFTTGPEGQSRAVRWGKK